MPEEILEKKQKKNPNEFFGAIKKKMKNTIFCELPEEFLHIYEIVLVDLVGGLS